MIAVLRVRLTGAIAILVAAQVLLTVLAMTPSAGALPAEADLLVVAHRAMERADWGAAERALRELLAVTPDATELHYLLAQVLFREQRATDSLAEYTAAARLRSPTADELCAVASDYILLKDYADAERWLRYATEESPGNKLAWYLLGRTQYKLDHAADAAASFKRCIELSPNDVRAEYNLGLALERLDRAADAEAAYRIAIEWQEKAAVRDPQPYLDLGMLLLAQRQAEQALPLLREAVALGPRNALAHQELGVTLEKLGQFAEAATALQRATVLAPEAEPPHFLLGRVYRRMGRSAEASAQFAEAQRLVGGSSAKETPNEAQSLGPIE